MIFHDRIDAGRQLGEALAFLQDRQNVIVLGIPRGGVVVAAQVARVLNAPLDLWFARKIGAPGNPEFAIGSIAAIGDAELDPLTLDAMNIAPDYVAAEVSKQRAEIERRARFYRGNRLPLQLAGKVAVLVDDGLATGSTAVAAVKSLRGQSPAEIILAVPVSPPDTNAKLRALVDKLVVLHAPFDFAAVGQYYAVFDQTSDEQVIELMHNAE